MQTQTVEMTPEDFVAHNIAEVAKSRTDKDPKIAKARLELVKKNVEVGKSFSFEGSETIPAETLDMSGETSTDVDPEKTSDGDPSSSTVSNPDDMTKTVSGAQGTHPDSGVAKKLDELDAEIAKLKKGDDDSSSDDSSSDDDSDDDEDKSGVNKGFGYDDDGWPEDLNDLPPNADPWD